MKEKRRNRVLAIFMALAMVFSIVPFFGVPAAAASMSVSITGKSLSQINSELGAALSQAVSGDIITVTGTKTNEDGIITLDITPGVTVVWQAMSEDLSFAIDGGGTFEVPTNGKITVTGKSAIVVTQGDVLISGGEVSVLRKDINDWAYVKAISVDSGNVTVTGGKVSTLRYSSAIFMETGNIRIEGGIVSTTGETTPENGVSTGEISTIRLDNGGTIVVTGGLVSATGAEYYNDAIFISHGVVAYYPGTIDGGFYWWYENYSIVLEVDSLNIPSTHHGTILDLTHIGGGGLMSDVHWDTSGADAVINFTFDGWVFLAAWTPLEPPVGPVEYPVRLADAGALTGNVFKTLSGAIAAAEAAGLTSYTLEVIGDVEETGNVSITSDVTIVGAEGAHTVTMSSSLYGNRFVVEDGGNLTLGDGTFTDLLTFLFGVSVTEGTIDVKDGIMIKSSKPLTLSGSNVDGTISGGYFDGGLTGLSMEKGAHLQEISGGVFFGTVEAVHITDPGTRIELISDGSFHQTSTTTDLHGQAIFVQNEAQIGEISGGYFEAVRSSALIVVRGARVDEISGGEFIAKSMLNTDNNPNTVISVYTDYNYPDTASPAQSTIGTISGGHYVGGHFAVLTLSDAASPIGSKIEKITGGVFEASIALQNDQKCVIDEITGGTFIGSHQGIFNTGKIGIIGGTANILGKTSYGIFNYFIGGEIGEISGGLIVSSASHGISNIGLIKLISGGTIIGQASAINNDGSIYKGKLEVITNGTFWGKNGAAIQVSSELKLEPDLDAIIGFGRYWGKDGEIFTNESFVVYPSYELTSPSLLYYMSTDTLEVLGIDDVEFKYLMFGEPPDDYYTVMVNNSHAAVTGEGIYAEGDTVTVYAGDAPAGYGFAYWDTYGDDDVVFIGGSVGNPTGSFVMPDHDVVVRAIWGFDFGQGLLYVTVIDSYADVTGAGAYREDDLVTINAGPRYGYTFVGWTTDSDIVFANNNDATTIFIMPNINVTVTANWAPMPDLYAVTVIDSYAGTDEFDVDLSGAGNYFENDTVTINAGTREGYDFIGWTTADGIVFFNAGDAITLFAMPGKNVTVTANWIQLPEPPEPYNVTVLESYADVTGAGAYFEDDTVTINAGEREGYNFAGWTTADGVTFANAGAATTTFVMPSADVTVTANWIEKLPQTGDNILLWTVVSLMFVAGMLCLPVGLLAQRKRRLR